MADCPGVGKGIFKKIEAEKVRSVPKGEAGLPPLAPGNPTSACLEVPFPRCLKTPEDKFGDKNFQV